MTIKEQIRHLPVGNEHIWNPNAQAPIEVGEITYKKGVYPSFSLSKTDDKKTTFKRLVYVFGVSEDRKRLLLAEDLWLGVGSQKLYREKEICRSRGHHFPSVGDRGGYRDSFCSLDLMVDYYPLCKLTVSLEELRDVPETPERYWEFTERLKHLPVLDLTPFYKKYMSRETPPVEIAEVTFEDEISLSDVIGWGVYIPHIRQVVYVAGWRPHNFGQSPHLTGEVYYCATLDTNRNALARVDASNYLCGGQSQFQTIEGYRIIKKVG